MNREIKFRVWDIVNKRILDYADIMTLPMWEVFPGTPEQRAYEVMQYTGLKDKNNNEIYEGDVLKQVKKSSREGCGSSSYDKNNFEVVFKYGSFWLQRPYDDSVYIRDFPNIDEFVGFECFEIVGNIYENPELLETK